MIGGNTMIKNRIAITTEEAAEMLGLSMTTMYELVHAEGFPSMRIGKKILISVEGLQNWLNERSGTGAKKQVVKNDKKWRNANDIPDRWHTSSHMLVSCIVFSPDHGVGSGSWVVQSKSWLFDGNPANVTHWMPFPDPPKEVSPDA